MVARWMPLPTGKIKVNPDTGWTGTTTLGFGLVARNHRSEFLVVASYMEEHRLDATMAEALAMRWALRLMRELDMDSVVVESDTTVVVKALKTGLRMASKFNGICFCHVGRKSNFHAHELVVLAHLYPDNIWWDHPPTNVAQALCRNSSFSLILQSHFYSK